MSQIWYAAFDEAFVEQAQEIFKKLGKDILVSVWNPEEAPRMLKKGVRVVMGRGATAVRIRNTLNLPVVDIPIPFEDLVDTLIEASHYGKRIAVVGYANILSGLDRLNPILNVNIRQVFPADSEDTFYQIQKLKEEGIDVIAGGLIQTRYARELGLPAVLFKLTERSLGKACAEAERLIEVAKNSARKTEEFQTILDTTREMYVAVDRKGRITWMNQVAGGYLPHQGIHFYEAPVKEIFPELDRVEEVLCSGQEVIQENASIGGIEVLYDIIPQKYQDGEILGAVIRVNDAGTITRGEHKIRNKSAKGFQAVYTFKDMSGNSSRMAECIGLAKKYARTDSTVLIMGETGSGKEMLAQSMHNASNRRGGPFVAVNCAALPEGILESELFGYDEGAFTGAKRNGKMGLFELAHNGTIFLDEIGEMPVFLQSRLLRVLQERKVMRLGGDKVFPVNVRVFAATNQNLIELVEDHKFRADLFYRLNVLTLKIPPLRERPGDIPVLAEQFLSDRGDGYRLTENAKKALAGYGWPGNARQLRHFVEKLCIICESSLISGRDVEYVIKNFEPPCQEVTESIPEEKEITRERLIEAIDKADGNKVRAAELLGIHRSTLWRYMKRFELE